LGRTNPLLSFDPSPRLSIYKKRRGPRFNKVKAISSTLLERGGELETLAGVAFKEKKQLILKSEGCIVRKRMYDERESA
jgi:hypothetical protein